MDFIMNNYEYQKWQLDDFVNKLPIILTDS